jgi:hypothetical protein
MRTVLAGRCLLSARRRLMEEAGAERDGQELKTSQSRSRGSLLSSAGWHGGVRSRLMIEKRAARL